MPHERVVGLGVEFDTGSSAAGLVQQLRLLDRYDLVGFGVSDQERRAQPGGALLRPLRVAERCPLFLELGGSDAL